MHFYSVPSGGEALGFSPSAPVSVVLEDDGTIVEDEDYFLCLPANSNFMLLNNNETWTPAQQGDITPIPGCFTILSITTYLNRSVLSS